MLNLRTLLSFIPVALTLVIYGKISKYDLYINYFRNIAEIEVRNSQRLAPLATFYAPQIAEQSEQDAAEIFRPLIPDFAGEITSFLPSFEGDTFSAFVRKLLRANPPMAP